MAVSRDWSNGCHKLWQWLDWLHYWFLVFFVSQYCHFCWQIYTYNYVSNVVLSPSFLILLAPATNHFCWKNDHIMFHFHRLGRISQCWLLNMFESYVLPILVGYVPIISTFLLLLSGVSTLNPTFNSDGSCSMVSSWDPQKWSKILMWSAF